MNNSICPLCKKENVFLYTIAKDYQNKQDNSEYKAYKCRNCDIIFQYPLPKTEDFDKLYPENYYAHVDDGQIPFLTGLLRVFMQDKKKALKFFMGKRLFPYFDILTRSQKVLDIGCGKGLFLDVLKEQGKETFGFEPDVNATKILEKKGHGVCSDLSDIQDNSFDLITMFQVLEHIENPSVLVHEIYRILKPGGYFIVETPNSVSKLASNKKFWRALEFPRHLILHSPQSVKHLLDKEAFQTKLFVRVSPTDIRETFSLKGTLKSPIYLVPYILFQYFFHAKKGSLLIVIAQKH
jgi:2-polyprenyl-3-methyl-5-hydroxy-6-metoxy-1,4-benzoquinol methylase